MCGFLRHLSCNDGDYSFVDVVKGIDMFDKLKVPIAAVVENMAYFTCPSCTTKHTPFGPSSREAFISQFGIKNAFEVPMVEAISLMSDSGQPFVLDYKDSTKEVRQIYERLADAVHQQLDSLSDRTKNATPQVRFDEVKGAFVITLPTVSADESPAAQSTPRELSITAQQLRRSCQCAGCIDEITGQRRLRIESVSADIKPVRIQSKGNYAVGVHWSDGHTSSIYPYETLIRLAEHAEAHAKSTTGAASAAKA